MQTNIQDHTGQPLAVSPLPHPQPDPAVEKQNNDLSDDSAITNWPYFLLFSYLYLLQGIVSGIIGTMPYIYPTLPDYNTMALFTANNVPFSLKFLIAPFLEKYCILSYGKRKTWMVFGCAAGGAAIIASSFLTDQKYSNLLAVLYIFAQTCMAFLDIAAHAAMIKELKSKSQTSIIIGYSQVVGILLGALLLLKLTSPEFAKTIGLATPITSPQILLLTFGIFAFIPAFYLHFSFTQTTLQSQKKGDRFTFGEIVCYYKTCLQPQSRYFRTCVFFLVSLQGLNFFNCLYDYELVKAGFSKDAMNTLSNLLAIPTIILTFFFGKWTNLLGGRLNSLLIIIGIIILLNLYLTIFFPLKLWVVALTAFVSSVLDSWRFYLFGYMINDFPVHALTGMFITFMASFSNLGKQTSIHTWICGKLGWKICSLVGLGIQAIILIFMSKFYHWVQDGNSHVPKEIEEDEAKNEGDKKVQKIHES